MPWLNREKAPLSSGEKKDTPDGLWYKCPRCSEIIYLQEFISNLYVCPKCLHHEPIPPRTRLERLLDPDSFKECDAHLRSGDPLKFVDSKPYPARLKKAEQDTGNRDAFVAGEGTLKGRPVQVGAFDFGFMGGSMGSVVGEKIARLYQRAYDQRAPAIVYSSSGGARMQEGILSLMQMAKTCAYLGRLRDIGVPYISVMCHPTTGGVAASFAMLGDINIAEPKALIGFAGPRVIGQTIKQELPEGFQRSEYLLEHGMLDMILPRDQHKKILSSLLDILLGGPPKSA